MNILRLCAEKSRSYLLFTAVVLAIAGCGPSKDSPGSPPPPAVNSNTPTVTLNALPATVSGTSVVLTATPTAAAGVARVEFLVDATVIANVTTPPFTATWNTSLVADGTHGVSARVTDTAGRQSIVNTNVRVTNTVTINVALSPLEEPQAATTPALASSAASGTGGIQVNLVTGAVTAPSTASLAALTSGTIPTVGTLTVRGFVGGTPAAPVAPILAHIHEAFAGNNGPILVNMTRVVTTYFCGATPCATFPATTATTVLTAGTNPQVGNFATLPALVLPASAITDISTVWAVGPGSALTSAQVVSLMAGRMYLNVHSAAFPVGEVRGQLTPDNVRVVFAQMTGGQEVPSVTTTGNGIAAVTYNQANNTVAAHFNSINVDAATVAHIHTGLPGTNGPIIINLAKDTVTANPNVNGHWVVEGQVISVNDARDFNASRWYTNIHTPTFPGGEIRGNVISPIFIANANGANEVPPVQVPYISTALVTVDPFTRSVCVRTVNPVPITDTFAAHHIHMGVAGVNGAIVIDWAGNISSCRAASATIVSGIIANPANFYYNLHTTTFTGGSVRAQLQLAPPIP
jgi:hypothetical protein